jgi:hypothetical protein
LEAYLAQIAPCRNPYLPADDGNSASIDETGTGRIRVSTTVTDRDKKYQQPAGREAVLTDIEKRISGVPDR